MTKKRMPAAETQRETMTVLISTLLLMVVDNRPGANAIIGTDLRDATGTITFGQFRNQIEYQNAGAALNKTMKQDVLSKVDTSKLSGKTVSVVGVFQLTDPANWQVTPVKLEAP